MDDADCRIPSTTVVAACAGKGAAAAAASDAVIEASCSSNKSEEDEAEAPADRSVRRCRSTEWLSWSLSSFITEACKGVTETVLRHRIQEVVLV